VATVEGSPDNLSGVVNDHRELLVLRRFDRGHSLNRNLGTDTGNADFPFERQGNAFIERGCIDKDSIVKLDNATWFVGDDRIVYRMNGYTPGGFQPMRLSERWLRRAGSGPSPIRRRGTNSTASTPMPDRGRMTLRPARGLSASFGLDYYRLGCAADAYGKTLVGDNQTGKIYQLDFDSTPRTATQFRSRSSFRRSATG
jgi:hypothetical protein